MHNSFLIFDFGSNEEAAQQARHKLEGWKQAFRLDKKLLYKFDREETEPAADAASDAEPAAAEKHEHKSAKSKSKPAKKADKSKSAAKNAKEEEDDAVETDPNANTKLLVRLYFSGHEKLSYQRWIDRLPNEELFKQASPQTIHQGDPQFAEIDKKFESLA
ncbi:MAG TPA: hypothetical protein VOA78_03805 [Candidatus Dormibacteraeota bacterium]|nr:hypothetical protein [Candidatus Dormibacteraeota bacterium]